MNSNSRYLNSDNKKGGLSLIESLNNLDAKLDMNLNHLQLAHQHVKPRNHQLHQSLDLKQHYSTIEHNRDNMFLKGNYPNQTMARSKGYEIQNQSHINL